MAQVIRYVDPDAGGAGNGTSWADAYTSLSAWNTGEATNLVTAGDYHTVYCRSSGGTEDTTMFTFSGWTTGAANYIEVIGNDFPSSGIWDGTKYVLHNNDSSSTGIRADIDYIRLINLQIKVTETSTNQRRGLYFAAIGASNDIRIDSCIIRGVCSGTGSAYGIQISDSSTDISIYNTLVYDFVSGADADFVGIRAFSISTMNCYNCTVYNCYTGIVRSSGTVVAKNCAVGNCTDNFSGTMTIDYCCSDAGEGTNAQTPSGGSWSNEFNNIAGGDFRLKVGGNCVNNGVNDPGSGLYSDDIVGTARS